MTDWNNPSTSQPHSQELQSTKERDEANARMDYSGESNIPDGAIRWSAANERFETWDATNTVWNKLSTKYLINVDKLDGRDAGNGAGDIPISNGNPNANLKAALAQNSELLSGSPAKTTATADSLMRRKSDGRGGEIANPQVGADPVNLQFLEAANFLKKSEFDPTNPAVVWSGSAKSVPMSSLSEGGPGIYTAEYGSTGTVLTMVLIDTSLESKTSSTDGIRWITFEYDSSAFTMTTHDENLNNPVDTDIKQIWKH